MAQNPRARVFVLFLDTYHVEIDGSHNIRKPLVDALDRLIGPDDLVAVMTPEMSAARHHLRAQDDDDRRLPDALLELGRARSVESPPIRQDEQYTLLSGLPPTKCPDGTVDDDRGVADEMIERRHEKMTLDALHDLVRYLRGVREERKAVLAITDGWLSVSSQRQPGAPLNCQPCRADDRRRSTDRQADRQGPVHRRGAGTQVRRRPDAAGAARQRSPVPRPARRGQPRERLVLSDRSARPGGVRHAAHAAGRARAAAAHRPAVGGPGDAARPDQLATHARRSHRRPRRSSTRTISRAASSASSTT